MDNKTDIKSMSHEQLKEYFISIGEKPFRAKQVYTWAQSGIESFSQMTNISAALQKQLEEQFYIHSPRLLQKLSSDIDGTIKLLWQMHDGAAVESVVMQYAHGNTVCISSQVGCAMGCKFCASTIGGLVRNLNPSEIVDQVLFSQKETGQKISNVVIMGIGEPLDNFDNIMRFIELINSPDGMNIGARHISLSTCGILEKIDKLAEYKIQLTLSVSLHAPDDETRSALMPINKSTGVDELIKACQRYSKVTGRRVSYEYAMISGINDTKWHGELLAKKLRHTGSHVNIIPLSEVSGRSLSGSKMSVIKAFSKILTENGVNNTIRRSLGRDITASCGQLRVRHLSEKNSG